MNETFLTCCLLLAACAVTTHGSESLGNEEISSKVKREVSGLIPFPRVGRSDPDLTWLFDTSAMKRKGLMAFPRIGRSNRIHGSQKRNNGAGGGSNSGLWFGPRLGRLQKRDSQEAQQSNESPWALIALREYPPVGNTRQQGEAAFTPRLGRESNEEQWDDYDSLKLHSSEHL